MIAMQNNPAFGNASPADVQRHMESAFSPSARQQYATTQALPSQQSSKTPGPNLKRKRSRQESPDEQKPPQANRVAASGDNIDQDPDKKKSKLGYQRSTIACVHCRRRKIRCVIPDNDRSGKCAHCIRMKKACSFVPVDTADADKKKRQVPLRKAMSEPSPVHTPYDASKDSNSWYFLDFKRPASGTHQLPPSSYAPGSLETTAPHHDNLLPYQDNDPLVILQTSQNDAGLQGRDTTFSASNWSGLERPFHRPLSEQTWSASRPSLVGRHSTATGFDERRPHTFPASYSPFPGSTFAEDFASPPSRAAFSPRSMSQPHSFYYTNSLASNIARHRSHTISMPPLVPTPSFEVPSIETPQDLPNEPIPESSYENPFNKTPFQASNPTAYLSPLTSTSDPSTSHPSVSPIPPRDTYLSPPTSEPTLDLSSDPTLPSLPTYVADETLQRYHAQQGWEASGQEPQLYEQMASAVNGGLGLYDDGGLNDRQAVFGETQAVFDDRQADFDEQQAYLEGRRTSFQRNRAALSGGHAHPVSDKAHLLDQQQQQQQQHLYNSIFALSAEQDQSDYPAPSMPEHPGSYFGL